MIPLLLVLLSAVLTGLGSGLLWRWGNAAAEAGTGWMILLAVPANLVVALAVYLGLRGPTSLARDDMALFVLLGLAHLGVLIWAATAAGVVGTGTGRVGAHVLTWGASYGYGQAFHDVRHGMWLGD